MLLIKFNMSKTTFFSQTNSAMVVINISYFEWQTTYYVV